MEQSQVCCFRAFVLWFDRINSVVVTFLLLVSWQGSESRALAAAERTSTAGEKGCERSSEFVPSADDDNNRGRFQDCEAVLLFVIHMCRVVRPAPDILHRSYQIRAQGPFDLAVVDEAAQSLEVSCYIPMLQGKRLLLAGDHKQLPPTVVSKQAEKEGFAVTLFDRLASKFGERALTMLTRQYRMHQDISKWSSEVMYQDRLVADDLVASHLLCQLPHVAETQDTSTPFVFIDTAGEGLHEDPHTEVRKESR